MQTLYRSPNPKRTGGERALSMELTGAGATLLSYCCGVSKPLSLQCSCRLVLLTMTGSAPLEIFSRSSARSIPLEVVYLRESADPSLA